MALRKKQPDLLKELDDSLRILIDAMKVSSPYAAASFGDLNRDIAQLRQQMANLDASLSAEDMAWGEDAVPKEIVIREEPDMFWGPGS